MAAPKLDVDKTYLEFKRYIDGLLTSSQDVPPLIQACIKNNVADVRNLFEPSDNTSEPINNALLEPMNNAVLNKSYLGVTPLHIACIYANSKIVDVLLGNNPNLKRVEETDKIAMLNTRTTIKQINTPAKEGISAEGSISEDVTLGATPLHLACLAGSDVIVQMLLDSGADRTLKYNDATPLDIAIQAEFSYIVKLLEPPKLPVKQPDVSLTKRFLSTKPSNMFTNLFKRGGTRKKNRKSRSRVRKTSKSRKRKVRNTRKNKL